MAAAYQHVHLFVSKMYEPRLHLLIMLYQRNERKKEQAKLAATSEKWSFRSGHNNACRAPGSLIIYPVPNKRQPFEKKRRRKCQREKWRCATASSPINELTEMKYFSLCAHNIIDHFIMIAIMFIGLLSYTNERTYRNATMTTRMKMNTVR